MSFWFGYRGFVLLRIVLFMEYFMLQLDIVLLGINVWYRYTLFGLCYFYVNLGELCDRVVIHESIICTDVEIIVCEVLVYEFKLVGIGVYIWNVECSEVVVICFKVFRFELVIVFGGFEVSYEIKV